MYDPAIGQWKQWKPAGRSHVYAVFVDDRDIVWLSEWESNAIVRFDPAAGKFSSFPSDRPGAQVRQLLGRRGELWGAESGTDRLVAVITK
jgi:virginiamycin B lyase